MLRGGPIISVFALLCWVSGWSVLGAERAPSDFTNHVRRLSAEIPSGFSVVVQPPFVVVGNESAQEVRSWATGTVKWAVEHLKEDYFERDPEEIIDIWLFKDEASYNRYTREIFHDTPSTPFGYYSARHHALIMNIATGGGTLVHEIVHPYVRANFPECPAWFNEGLGSLYEQSGEKGGHIYGYTNWRLADLQTAIRARRGISFEKLLAMDDAEFYEDRGLKYAHARYLCYYLQEKGLLVKFYRQFRGNVKEDPTGLKSLKAVLGTGDLAKFQSQWEQFVLKLQFP